MSSWVQLDDLRENWVVLLLGTADQPPSKAQSELLYYELGVANSDQLIDTTTHHVGHDAITNTTDLIQRLLEDLAEYRYTDATVLTPTTWTIQELRRQLTSKTHDQASLRGFTHISIEAVLSEYFGQCLTDYELDHDFRTAPRITEAGPDEVVTGGAVRDYWQCWQQIFRLIPADELGGTDL